MGKGRRMVRPRRRRLSRSSTRCSSRTAVGSRWRSRGRDRSRVLRLGRRRVQRRSLGRCRSRSRVRPCPCRRRSMAVGRLWGSRRSPSRRRTLRRPSRPHRPAATPRRHRPRRARRRTARTPLPKPQSGPANNRLRHRHLPLHQGQPTRASHRSPSAANKARVPTHWHRSIRRSSTRPAQAAALAEAARRRRISSGRRATAAARLMAALATNQHHCGAEPDLGIAQWVRAKSPMPTSEQTQQRLASQ
jgi:hypothetical protein